MKAVARQPRWQHWGSLARWGVPVVTAALMGCANPSQSLIASQPAAASSSSAANASAAFPVAADAHKRAQIRLELAANYFQAGRLDVATEEVGQALAANPNSADAYALLGLILMQQRDFPRAEVAMKKAMELNPQDGNQIHNYGWLQCELKHFDSAQQWFDKALQQPRYMERARTLLAKGTCYQQAGQLDAAYQTLFQAYEMEPGNPVVGYNLANVLWQKGDVQKAQFYLRRVNNNNNQATAESLWLAIRVDRALHDDIGVRQSADQLQRRFPHSRQWLAYERGAFNE